MDRQIPPERIATFLRRTSLLSSCPQDDLLELAQAAEHQRYPGGTAIFPPGRPIPGLGFLATGSASLVVVDAATNAQNRLEQLKPGDCFGEVGFLLGGPNPLSVIADEDCNVLIVDKNQVERCLARHPEIALALAKRISSRFVRLSVLGARGGGQSPESTPPAAPVAEPARDESSAEFSQEEIRWVDVGQYQLTPEVLGLVPPEIILQHRLLPLELRDKELLVGLVNPRSVGARQALRRVLHTVDPRVVAISADDFNQAFVRLKLGPGDATVQKARGDRAVRISYEIDQEKEAEKGKLHIEGEVTSLFDRILLEAVERNASDIHIEPDSTGVTVRYRIHGALVDRSEHLSPTYGPPLLARTKVLAELDLTERRHPQDGRITAYIGRRELNLRVSTIPVARGEKAVIRIIDPNDVMRPLRQIFLNPNLEQAVLQALSDPYGAIIVAGPTGSGKSSTLYSMLNSRKTSHPDAGIVTVEDPVEFLLQGITQVPVLPQVGFGFANALRGLMRQDPDVIMIGELRDGETATIMVEAALTGHLVLTSIHGNNVAAVIQRLQHLGSDPVLLSQALSMIVVQRLAKRLCPNCVKESEVPLALAESLVAHKVLTSTGGIKLPHPTGCADCKGTGYLGRIAVHEVLDFDESIRSKMASGATPAELVEAAAEGRRFTSFAKSAATLMARRLLAPNDALLLLVD